MESRRAVSSQKGAVTAGQRAFDGMFLHFWNSPKVT